MRIGHLLGWMVSARRRASACRTARRAGPTVAKTRPARMVRMTRSR